MSRDPAHPAAVLRRVGLILLGVFGMVQLLVWFHPDRTGPGDFRSVSMVREAGVREAIAAEAGPFRDLAAGQPGVPLGQPSPHVVVPTRAERRERRAFEGAPPFIPHPLDPEVERTQDCRPCHQYGGYAPGLRTFAPRSPHPEQSNCLQCHVRPVTSGVYVESEWSYVAWPAYGTRGALQGAPPPIPHALQMREHCLACHGGTAAAPDIRTSHPERFNCRQCHVPAEVTGAFSRPVRRGGSR